ncbi:MAG: carbohydrate kinase [Planctomycetes bacterium]|nr:carbohydrate kinase [Planctomycetota bacterium]
MSIYLGLDSSTQSLSALVIDFEARKILADLSISFGERLPQYGCPKGVLPHEDPAVAHSDPLLWLAALDLLLAELKARGIEPGRIEAVAGSGQQHGSVYLNDRARDVLASLKPRRHLADQLKPALSRSTSPIWMDFSTGRQCAEITEALGGAGRVAELTGSSCFERFTGPQIRKFWQTEPARYEKTARIHLVSSFMASVLAGRHAPIDFGDGAGMNLMDLRARNWSAAALKATAPGLKARLPRLASSDTIVGRISPYFVHRYGFSPRARIAAWSGDNPCSLIGVGLISAGKVCISLGTSDTYFGFMAKPHVSTKGEGHVFGSPTGDFMSLICFLNGSLARERVRDQYGLSWAQFSQVLRETKPGNGGAVLLPYFAPEITPNVPSPQVRRYGLDASDVKRNVRAVIEAQMASMALHARWMGVKTRTVYATGGASANREILQVMANLHDAEVYQFPVGKSAALGAALRAAHASLKADGKARPWKEIVAGFAEPVAESRVRPDPAAVRTYRGFLKLYEACEAHALRGGEDPAGARERYRRTSG